MELILSILQVVISVILICLVLMHSGKDSGLSGAFGVGQGLGGGPRMERNLDRWTVGFVIAFVAELLEERSDRWRVALYGGRERGYRPSSCALVVARSRRAAAAASWQRAIGPPCHGGATVPPR